MYGTDNLILHVKESVANAAQESSKINQKVLLLEGMSSRKNKHLLNNLMNMPDVNYLEIGVHKGSTFISALYQNEVNSAYAIDNWSQFGNQASFFLEICKKFKVGKFLFFDDDCFDVNLKKIKHTINVYFYDGYHSPEATKEALTYYYDILDDVFIYIVDDFNWSGVQEGTAEGIKECNLEVLYEQQLLTNKTSNEDSWWNGIYVAVLKKIKDEKKSIFSPSGTR